MVIGHRIAHTACLLIMTLGLCLLTVPVTACCGGCADCPDETECRWQDGGQCKALFRVLAEGSGHCVEDAVGQCGIWKPYVAFQGCPSSSCNACGQADRKTAHVDYILCPEE